MNDQPPVPGDEPRLPVPRRELRDLPAVEPRGGTLAQQGDALDADEIDLRDIWTALRRRRRSILFTLLTVTAAVAVYLYVVTPVWYAKTLVLVEDESTGELISPALTALTGIRPGGSQIETEMRLVQTRPVVEDVVDAHELNLVVTKPRHVPRELLFTALGFGRGTSEGRYHIGPSGATGRYRIRSAGDDTAPLDVEFSPGDTVEIPGGWFTLADLANGQDSGGDPLPTEIDLGTLTFQEAVEELSETITVSRPDRDAAIIQIGYRTTDPSLVHRVSNRVADSYVARRIATQRADAASTVSFLDGQVEQTRQELERVEAQLQSFREGERIVALGAEAEAQVSRLATVEAQRTQLDAERAALAELMADIDRAGGRPDYRRLASFPTFFANDAVTQLLVKLIEADQDRASLLARLTPSHPDVMALEGRIRQLEDQLGAIGQNYLRALTDQISALDTVLARFGAELEQVPEREIAAARIERQVAMLAELYTVLQTRLKEAQVKEAIDDSGVRIVERAIPPLEPLSPKPARALALALVLGLLLGVILALMREYMDRRLRASDRTEILYGLPTMARIPWLAADGSREGQAGLVTLNDSGSVAAESFRSLRTKVGYMRRDRGTDEFVVTSPSPGEGKSLTAANLAIAMAQRGMMTVLVDADMRRPVQHAHFGSGPGPGLSDCLLADGLLEGAVRPTMLESLFLLPAGRRPSNPVELLDSTQMDRLMEALRDRFGTVILDAPPVLAATDAAVLAPRTKGVILVVRAGKTDRESVSLAIEQIGQVGGEVLGIVVNDSRSNGSYRAYFTETYGGGTAGVSGGLRGVIRRIASAFS